MPSPEGMYSPDFATFVDLDHIDLKAGEGASRPGFFRGVATVCTKLFNIVQPEAVYFGQKDALQCTVIRRIVSDLNMPLEVKKCPTSREADGLAMSTRNAYLAPKDRVAAPVLYEALEAAALLSRNSAWLGRDEIIDFVTRAIKREPRVQGVDYISLADPNTGNELEKPLPGAVLSAAVQ